MKERAVTAERPGPPIDATKIRSGRCLVVHDDLELRLRLASLVRRAFPKVDADCISGASFDALPPERVAGYAALLLIVEFDIRGEATDPLIRLARSRERVPRLPIFVFARGGNERNAARTIKLGANDYWPIHSVKVSELAEVLQPFVEAGPAATAAAPVDSWRQPRIAGYRLLKTLGESAATVVHLARKDDMEQPIALKVQALTERHGILEADRERFVRECQILSALNHRSIAPVLDFGVTDEYFYLAQEYFPHGSLRDRLKTPVSELDAVGYARQIGEALEVLHAAGLAHRGLKPSNLMLTDDHRMVLIDFGSLRTAESASAEPIDNREPVGRGDLYRLGAMLFEMLAGSVPVADIPAEILAGQGSVQVPRLPRRFLRYQPIIDRVLAKESENRYDSATLFLEDLKAVTAPIRTSI